jgi:DNA-binding GntR family transcriptional regulator
LKIRSLVDRTVKHLEDMIIKGKLRPGQKIKEQEIAERLGISRPPVREAFKMLEAEGLVRRQPRRGVFVAELNKADIWEIYTLKTALYTLAVGLAINKVNAGNLSRLEKIVDRMEEIVQGPGEPDVMKYEELNSLFHDTTADIAGHGLLKKFQMSLNNRIKRIAYRSFLDREHLQLSCQYHRRILEAMKAKEKAVAEQITREHVQRGLAVQERLYRRHGETL